jgi:hypothetical protein
MWEWFDGELAGIRDILRSPQCLDRGVFHPDRLREDMSSDVVWPLINLELWFRIFVDRDPHWVERAATLAASRLVHSGGTPVRS